MRVFIGFLIMNQKLVLIIASLQFYCVSASSFTPPQSPMKHSFSPYSPISYLAPSPKSVALCSPVRQVVSFPLKNKEGATPKQVKHKDQFIKDVTNRPRIDTFIALGLKHEESLLRRSEKTKKIQDGKIDFNYWG